MEKHNGTGLSISKHYVVAGIATDELLKDNTLRPDNFIVMES